MVDEPSGSTGSRSGSSHAAGGLLGAIAEQRHDAARQQVAEVRRRFPGDSSSDLCTRLIRACALDLAMAGAVSGGAAASPAAGPTGTAALLGAEGAMNASRLGELVMAIGILHGHHDATSGDRALWLAAALSAAEGSALGLTGMAARAGVRGSARLLRRFPAAPGTQAGNRLGGLGRSAFSAKGPWGLAALLPYTLGASVGAVGNTALTLSVGHAAIRYFSSGGKGATTNRTRGATAAGQPRGSNAEEIWDVEVVSERIIDDN